MKYTLGFDLFTACETLQFYTSIGEVILKIHLTQDEKIKVTVYANQEKSVQVYIHAHDFFCVFFVNY